MGVMNKFMNLLGLEEEEDIRERDEYNEYEEEMEPNTAGKRNNKGNVVSIHSQKNVRVVLNEPRSYEETQEIADHLRSRRPVVVNLQRVRSDQAVRIVDFLSGTVYALNGSISKVGPNIFLCTPESVEIQGSITEILNDEADYNKTR
jgi:cell division inhibitor SepF